jgi:pyruvate,water dikinase
MGRSEQCGEGWVTALDLLTADERIEAGGKAVHLGAMIRAGLPVPGGFCVLARGFRLWCAADPGLGEALARGEQWARGDGTEVGELGRWIRGRLEGLAVPGAVRDAIADECGRRGVDVAWAVRSSASVEDAPGASFAGQHDTWLNVRGAEAVVAAVQRCWVSMFTDRALAYRGRMGLGHDGSAMAVVVQEMVDAEVSGVMFTGDPAGGGGRRIVLEATYGLGEALVGGKVSPDRIEVDRTTLGVGEAVVGSKAIEMRMGDSGGVIERVVPVARRGQLCLEEGPAQRLGELGIEVERLFGGPQDIEWAVAGGQVFLLQARPITTRSGLVQAGQRPVGQGETGAGLIGPDTDIWTNANAMEALPDVVTPMAWSMMEVLLREFLHPLMRRLGLDPGGPALVGLIAGRAYLNVRCIHALVRRVSASTCAEVARAFGGEFAAVAALAAEGARPSVGARLAAVARALRVLAWLVPGLVGQRQLIERWQQRSLGGPALTPPEDLDDAALGRHPLELLRRASVGEGERTWAAAAWMAISGVGGGTLLFRLTRRWFGDADGSVANRLLAGVEGMNSAENGLELARLAAWIRSCSGLKAVLLAPVTAGDLAAQVAGVAEGPEFLERWRAFLKRHGHQARGGMDVAQPRWSEHPGLVLDMLRVYLGFDQTSDPLAARQRRLRAREELLVDCHRRLGNPVRRGVLRIVLWASQRGLVQRENIKNEGVRLVAILRRLALEAGRRLVERRALPERGDVFFLRVEELEDVLAGRALFDVAGTIASRKLEFARHRAMNPPALVIGQFDPRSVPTPMPVPADQNPTRSIDHVLHGVPVSPGVVTGRARVIRQCDSEERVLAGEILVAPYTDPGWTPYFLAAAGLVVDVGGQMSHGSIVAREYGLPAVVNVGAATTRIRTGQRICVDGTHGLVTLLD